MRLKTQKTTVLTRPIFLELDHTGLEQELTNIVDNQKTAINEVSRFILPYVRKYPHKLRGFLIRDMMMGYKSAKSDFLISTDLPKIISGFHQICDKYRIKSSTKKVREDIATIVGQMYISIHGRHDNISAPMIKSNKDMRTNKSLFRITKDNNQYQLSTEIIEGESLVVPIKNVLNQTYSGLINNKKDYGGFLKKRKSGKFLLTIIGRTTFQESYVPTGYLGIDINKRDDVYVTFSDGSIILKPAKLAALCKKCEEWNKKIKDTSIKSKQRTLIRKQWRNIQHEIKKEATKLAQSILDKVVNGKFLLCIDGAKPGSGSGEYGQILSSILRNKCEQQNIPHIWVESWHTSTTCTMCGHRDKKSRKTESEFQCTSCGHKEQADLHAAKYIGQEGWRVYNT